MNKLFTILVACLLLVMPMALAQDPITVDAVSGSAAIVSGSGTPPVVEYNWVLPDEDDLEEGTQVDVLQAGQRDDIYACLVVGDVEGRDTIIDVFTDVYHPDGTFKYQIHAEKITRETQIRNCAAAAVAAGLIDSQDEADIMYNIFDQQNWYMWKVYLPMYYHQPAGQYRVEGYAVDSMSWMSNNTDAFFTWVPGTYLALDFTTIDFGNIQPGAWKILNGDLDFATAGAPTLRNEGNTEVLVGVEFSEFVGQDNLPNKVIDDFDAQLRNLGTNNHDDILGEHFEVVAGQLRFFLEPIELCRQEKLDLSIHADIGTVPDNYAGSVTIYAEGVQVDAPEADTFPFPRDVPQ